MELCYLEPAGEPWIVFTAWHAGVFGWLVPSDGSQVSIAQLHEAFTSDVGVLPPGQWAP